MEAVRLMSSVAERFSGKVKAAGGISTIQDVRSMLEAGAYPLSISMIYPSCLRLVSERVMLLTSCCQSSVFHVHTPHQAVAPPARVITARTKVKTTTTQQPNNSIH